MAGTFTLCCYLPLFPGMHGSMLNLAAIMLFPPLIHFLPKRRIASLTVFMIFITTLAIASWAATRRSTFFRCNIVNNARACPFQQERTCSVVCKAKVRSNWLKRFSNYFQFFQNRKFRENIYYRPFSSELFCTKL